MACMQTATIASMKIIPSKNDNKTDIFIDDRNIGGLPDWGTIYSMITYGTSWYQLISKTASGNDSYATRRHHRPWWKRFLNIH